MKFLAEQLASLAAQTWPRINLHISDDGSTDGTWEYLEQYCRGWTKGAARLVHGPKTGEPAANFRSLVLGSDESADFTAFCDQDDIWMPEKLAGAVAALNASPAGQPTLYCSRTALIDEAGRPIGYSPAFRRPPGFRNALVQSLAGGNTMVLNQPAFALVRESSRRTGYPSHDWWTYIIVSGAGGRIIYSTTPDTLYRQHGGNVTGSNLGWTARLSRLWHLMHGRFRRWNDENLAALALCEDTLTAESVAVLGSFKRARCGYVWSRVSDLHRSGVYRQTPAANAMLVVATALGWT